MKHEFQDWESTTIMMWLIICMALVAFIAYYYTIIWWINRAFRSKDGMCRNGFHFWKMLKKDKYYRTTISHHVDSARGCTHCGRKVRMVGFASADSDPQEEVICLGRFDDGYLVESKCETT